MKCRASLGFHLTHVMCAVCRGSAGEVQPQLDAAVQSLTAAGIHVVVAAGNEDADACGSSPARVPSAVTAGASDVQDQRLWLAAGQGSNYGPCGDLFAPGVDILSAGSVSDTAEP